MRRVVKRKPKLLDLFCGAGGAGYGYYLAGFTVTGVDIVSQPRYPFKFVQADALEYLKGRGHEYDVIHASPPCQKFTAMRTMYNAREHADLLSPTRDVLQDAGKPYVIENVVGAPLKNTVKLCGSMFGLKTHEWELRRHRLFESSMLLSQLSCCHSTRSVIGFYGDHARIRARTGGHKDRGTDITGTNRKLELVKALMGIDWMMWTEANQAIPPAYTEYIGCQLLGCSGHG